MSYVSREERRRVRDMLRNDLGLSPLTTQQITPEKERLKPLLTELLSFTKSGNRRNPTLVEANVQNIMTYSTLAEVESMIQKLIYLKIEEWLLTDVCVFLLNARYQMLFTESLFNGGQRLMPNIIDVALFVHLLRSTESHHPFSEQPINGK